jgi:hypothetical protein
MMRTGCVGHVCAEAAPASVEARTSKDRSFMAVMWLSAAPRLCASASACLALLRHAWPQGSTFSRRQYILPVNEGIEGKHRHGDGRTGIRSAMSPCVSSSSLPASRLESWLASSRRDPLRLRRRAEPEFHRVDITLNSGDGS